MHESDVDVVVLGAGPGGEVAAGRLAQAGLEVAVVEARLVGGECSFWGCMPSKALLRPGELLDEVGRVPGAREALSGGVDAQATLDRRDEVIHDLDDAAQLPWLEDRGIRLLRGHGRLAGERSVEVDLAEGTERLRVRRAVIVATGTRPLIPGVPGLAEVGGWTNREGTTADEVPGRLLVMGGGPIGAEMAQAWASLGSAVTLLEGGARILTREEEFASEQVADGLRAHGVAVRAGAKIVGAHRDGNGAVRVELDGGETLEADEILVAVGRTPNTGDLGLDTAGVTPDEHGMLVTDDALRVGGRDWLYGVGDVIGRGAFTHVAKRQARVACARILGDETSALDPDELDGNRSPRTTFTDPQVAAVGHTLASARDAGLDAHVVDVPTDGNAGASFWGKDAGGTTRFVYDRTEDVLLGATFVGAGVVEQLHAATIAVAGRVPLSVLDRAPGVFPTRNEVWLPLVERE